MYAVQRRTNVSKAVGALSVANGGNGYGLQAFDDFRGTVGELQAPVSGAVAHATETVTLTF